MSAICAPRSKPIRPTRITLKRYSVSVIASTENNMSRSITVKLILAFLVVSIVVVALASVITYYLTVREFKQLVINQARDRFVADATLYYQIFGSWQGALAYFNLRDTFPGVGGPGGPGPVSQQPGIVVSQGGQGQTVQVQTGPGPSASISFIL